MLQLRLHPESRGLFADTESCAGYYETEEMSQEIVTMLKEEHIEARVQPVFVTETPVDPDTGERGESTITRRYALAVPRGMTSKDVWEIAHTHRDSHKVYHQNHKNRRGLYLVRPE